MPRAPANWPPGRRDWSTAGQGRARARRPAPGQLPAARGEGLPDRRLRRPQGRAAARRTCCNWGPASAGSRRGRTCARAGGELGGGGPAAGAQPRRAPIVARLPRARRGDNRYFGRSRPRRVERLLLPPDKHPRRWSAASRLQVDRRRLAGRPGPGCSEEIEADGCRSSSAAAAATCWRGGRRSAGRTLDVIVKRPRRRYWYRYLNEIGRGAAAGGRGSRPGT